MTLELWSQIMDKSFCAREKPKSGKNAYRRRVHIYISEAEI